MFKFLTITILSVLLFQTAKAEKTDTLLYYMKNNGEIVDSKDSADYFTLIFPADSTSNEIAYPVTEYYINGKRKLVGTTTLKISCLNLTGPCVTFFPNGHRESVSIFEKGHEVGEQKIYYSNGKLQNIKMYRNYIQLLVECRDSTGNMLAENGKGKWIGPDNITYTIDRNIISEGNIVDSLRDGDWRGYIGDTGKYVCTYVKGKLISGIGYDKLGKAHSFDCEFVQPAFDPSMADYANFIGRNLHYPVAALEKKIQGKVIVTFIVGKDGKPSNFEIIKSPDKDLSHETIRVISLMKFIPGLYYGMPIPSYFTIPLSFSLGNQ